MAKRRACTHTAPTNEIKAHSQHRNHFTLKKRVHRNENTIQMTHLAVLDLFHRITANRWNQTEPNRNTRKRIISTKCEHIVFMNKRIDAFVFIWCLLQTLDFMQIPRSSLVPLVFVQSLFPLSF